MDLFIRKPSYGFLLQYNVLVQNCVLAPIKFVAFMISLAKKIFSYLSFLIIFYFQF
jgi:hypothetical protein